MPLSLIGYIRVSTQTQGENTSFESQEAVIKSFCSRQGHTLVDTRKEIVTASGNIARIVFNTALQDVLTGEADGLIVARLDRYARSTLEGLQVAARLIAAKKELVAVDCGFDTSTPLGKCVLSILLSFAELERTMIVSRVVEGKQRAIDNGFYGGGRTPYGFISYGERGQRRLKPHPEQYPILAYIFREHSNGRSFYEIARELNRKNIPTKLGKQWRQSTLFSIVNAARKLPNTQDLQHQILSQR